MKNLAADARSRSAWSVPRINRTLYFVIALVALCHVTARANPSLPGQIAGTVLDQTGASVGGASVILFGAAGLEAQRSLTDSGGHFTLDKVVAADYVLSVRKNGFRELRRVLRVTPGETLQLEFQLNVASIFETVTVTPARGQPLEVFHVPQSPVVVTQEEMARHYANILPQALRDTPGVHIQQTTSGQGSPFVRGLTGQQVLHLINGVHFNNATFRPGANQYTALIDHDFADRIEVVRGPGSTQYGSDSLGGTINVLTRPPKGSDSFGFHGNVNTYFASADLSVGLSANVTGGSDRWGF